MNDRELLERAAKAAGIVLSPLDTVWDDATAEMVPWSPLTDDGDALRLAVKLGICIGPNFDGDQAVAFHGMDGRNVVEPFAADPYAATRRAIVRAAAALSGE